MSDDDVASTEGDHYNTTPEHRADAAGYNGSTGTNASNVTNGPDDILTPPIDHPHHPLARTRTQLREIETLTTRGAQTLAADPNGLAT